MIYFSPVPVFDAVWPPPTWNILIWTLSTLIRGGWDFQLEVINLSRLVYCIYCIFWGVLVKDCGGIILNWSHRRHARPWETFQDLHNICSNCHTCFKINRVESLTNRHKNKFLGFPWHFRLVDVIIFNRKNMAIRMWILSAIWLKKIGLTCVKLEAWECLILNTTFLCEFHNHFRIKTYPYASINWKHWRVRQRQLENGQKYVSDSKLRGKRWQM